MILVTSPGNSCSSAVHYACCVCYVWQSMVPMDQPVQQTNGLPRLDTGPLSNYAIWRQGAMFFLQWFGGL